MIVNEHNISYLLELDRITNLSQIDIIYIGDIGLNKQHFKFDYTQFIQYKSDIIYNINNLLGVNITSIIVQYI
jgi:hypothetical protein